MRRSVIASRRSPAETGPAVRTTSPADASGSGLSDDAQDLMNLRRDVDRLLDGKYQDQQQAHENLSHLDEAGQDRLRGNPEEIGALRQGVDPGSVDTERLAGFSRSYEYVKPEARREVDALQKEESRDNAPEPDQKQNLTAEQSANQALTNAASVTHHISI